MPTLASDSNAYRRSPRTPATRLRLEPFRMCSEVLLGAAEIFGGIDRQPQPGVAEGAQLSLRGELGKGGRLVGATFGKPRKRPGPEHVDAAADPALDCAALGEAGDPVTVELDDTEGRLRLRDSDRRRGSGRAVVCEQAREIHVEQLVAVQRQDVARLPPLRRG